MRFRVVIIGAKGMLGQALVRAFSQNNSSHPPLILRGGDRSFPPLNVRGGEEGLRRGDPPLIIRGGEGELFAWDREECDITNAALVMKKIGELQPALIINAAAYNDVDGAEKDATLANKINGDAIGYLADAATKVGATFVHYSTDYVFDGTKKYGYREDDAPNPISAYGKSKLLGEEKIFLSLRGAHAPEQSSVRGFTPRNNFAVYLIRTSRLFGAQGSGKQSFVDAMLERIQKKDTFEIVDEEYACPTYAEDLAQRTREIIEQKKPSGIYHVTNSAAVTWYGFAQEIFRQAHELGILTRAPLVMPVPSSRFPRPAKRPAYSQLLNTKLPPLRSWQEALGDYLSEKV
ncbi:dTDP-4-dehydrorhamnose reductase [Candidatus Uhrbacteria bacterium]|nr:dTDP-4-dehydrorhamnose reductase [Candidatus Uhrbacteria bacterium]